VVLHKVLYLRRTEMDYKKKKKKDVSFAPVSRATAKKLRVAISVEKSGGGV
jgi:hypothetical protein